MEANLHPEYESYFRDFLCSDGEQLSRYSRLFDFRDPKMKKREFSRLAYRSAWAALEKRYGRVCQLAYAADCEPHNPTVIDHLIPHASNMLNKQIKGARGQSGKKAPNESFGSNDLNNLALACHNCNSAKMNLIRPELLRRILKEREW